MSERVYREGRVKVSEKIEEAIIKLVEQEKDFDKKKKHPAKWYQAEVTKKLKLTEAQNPSLRSYESRLADIRKALQSKPPIDKPWSIGSCVEYGIPADIIPHLVEEQKVCPREQTVRQAIWFARLYPIIDKLIDSAHPDASPLLRLGYHTFIADQYAECERLSKILGKDHPDTSDLDKLYFIDGELDITEGWFRSYFPEEYEKAQKALENYAPLSKEALEAVLGKVTKEQADLLNDCLYIMYLFQVHPREGFELLEKHPHLKTLIEECSERPIANLTKDGAK